MPKKPQNKPVTRHNSPTFNIKDGIHVTNGNVIMGSQMNYNIHKLPNSTEFIAKLNDLQTQILQLKQQNKLVIEDNQHIENAAKQVQIAIIEAEQPHPIGERIRTSLKNAQQTLELLTANVQAAVELGATLATVGAIAIKLFGG